MSEKQTKVAAVIKPPREFETNGKTLKAHDVVFDDGEEGSCVTGPGSDEAQAMQDALLAIKGQPTEFELDNPREFQGVRKWKIVGFPGKPKGSGGGGGGRRDWVDQTPSMEAQGAVKNAISALGPYDPTTYDNLTGYAGTVRELGLLLYRVVQDIKAKGSPPAEQPKRPMQEDAVRVFGTEGAVQIAYKRMFGTGTAFKDIADDELEALIEQKSREEEG